MPPNRAGGASPRPVPTVDFYGGYRRDYAPVLLRPKHVRQFDHEFARASGFQPAMSVLELGCGNGLFLQYLAHRGAGDFVGVDQDADLAQCMPPAVAEHFVAGDFWAYLAETAGRRAFDRVALFDVLEHFPAETGCRLLEAVAQVLAAEGAVVARMPNLSSPWGAASHFNDLTHATGYTPGSLAQLAKMAGLRLERCLPQVHPSRWKQAREDILNGALRWFLAHPPEVFSAQMIAVLRRP